MRAITRHLPNVIDYGGSLIVSYVLTMFRMPPTIYGFEDSGISIVRVFALITGLFSAVLYKKWNKAQHFCRPVIMIPAILILGLSYEYLYSFKSVACRIDTDEVRAIISSNPIKQDSVTSENFKTWSSAQDSIGEFLSSNHCASTKIWNLKDILVQYYSLICIFIAFVFSVTITLVWARNNKLRIDSE